MPTSTKGNTKGSAPKGGSPEELRPTSIEEWGKAEPLPEEGFITELPSGNRALVRRTLDLPILLKSGQIPNPLSGIVRRMMDTGDPTILQQEARGVALEQLLDLLASNTCKTMLSPKVSRPDPLQKGETWDNYLARIDGWEPDPGTLSVFQITMPDQTYLFAIAQGMATDLASFRDEALSALVSVQDGEDVSRAPKPTSRTGAKPKRSSAKKGSGRSRS